MTEQTSGWLATGLYWNNQVPGLGLADPSGAERTAPTGRGTYLGYRLGAVRRCIGIWLAPQRRRQPCPFGHPLQQSETRAQCEPCAAADPGQRFARNSTADDGRDYLLYVAWFGPGMTKIGLTAAERGTDRLAEQAALAFTCLARGRLPAVRAAEQAISASGCAPERRQRRAKLAAWWQRTTETQRRDELRVAYQHIVKTVLFPAGLVREPCVVVDQVELFGLDDLPESCREITALSPGTVLCGQVRCAAGRDLLLDTPDGPLLCDARLLAGWPVRPTTAAPSGLELRACPYPRNDHAADQAALF